jgi:hypothetical protein
VGLEVFLYDETAQGVPDEHWLASQFVSDSAYVVNVISE